VNHIDSEHLYNSPSSLAGYSDKMLELLLFALKDLKMALKSQESDMLIGLGNAEDVLLKIVNEVTMQGLCYKFSLRVCE